MPVPSSPLIYPQGAGQIDQIQLWWRPPFTDGDFPVIYYTLRCPELSYSQQFTNDTSNTVISVPNSINYYFNITATNIVGDSAPAYFDAISAGYEISNAISTISAFQVSPYTAQIDWTYVPKINEQVLHSFVVYGIPSTVGAGLSTVVYNAEPWLRTYNISGLSSFYSFFVGPVGTGALWSEQGLTTDFVFIGNPPSPITDLIIVLQTDTTLDISWNGGDRATTHIYTFVPDDGSAPFTKIPTSETGTSASFTGTDTWQNYSSGPMYTLKISASNTEGIVFSQPIQIRFGPYPPTNVIYANVTISSFRLLWSDAKNASSFKFSLDSGSTFIYTDWSPNPYGSSSSGSALFNNLTLGTFYSGAIVYAMNGASTIATSSLPPYSSITLLPGFVTGITVNVISQSSFTLNWDDVQGASSLIYVGLQPAITNGIIGPSVYTGLSANTYYSTIITTNSIWGTGGSVTTIVKTATDPPTGITQSPGTNSTLNISWTGVVGAEYYTYNIWDLGENNVATGIVSSSINSVTVGGLLSNTTYITAITSNNTYWSTLIASTSSEYVQLVTGPGIPVGLSTSNISTNQFLLYWSGADGASSLTFQYASLSVVSSVTNAISPININHLSAGVEYTVSIIANNSKGTSVSNSTIVNTLPQPTSDFGPFTIAGGRQAISGPFIAYSPDGINNWSTINISSISTRNSIAISYDDHKFLMAYGYDTNVLYSSVDGIVWAPVSSPNSLFGLGPSVNIGGLVFANYIWMISVQYNIFTSSDGITWTPIYGEYSGNATSVSFAYNKFFVGTNVGYVYWTNNNGVTWTKSSSQLAGVNGNVLTVVGDANGYILGYAQGTSSVIQATPYYYSSNGTDWTLSSGFSTNLYVYGLCIRKFLGNWWAVFYGYTVPLMYSTDNGRTWTAPTMNIPQSLVFATSLKVAGSYLITTTFYGYYYSSDGSIWMPITSANALMPAPEMLSLF